jgi:hypothetical protein
VGLGFSNLWSDKSLLKHDRSYTYTPTEVLALGGYLAAAGLGLGDKDDFQAVLSYTVMIFIFEFFKQGIPKN